MPRSALALLALVLLAPLVTGSAADPYAPARVMAEAAGTAAAIVEWTPGTEPADSYRVYGLQGSSLTLLVDTADTLAPLVLAVTVPAGYSEYAVSGVKNGLESNLVFSGALSLGCIRISTDPPGIHEDGCKFDVDLKLRKPS